MVAGCPCVCILVAGSTSRVVINAVAKDKRQKTSAKITAGVQWDGCMATTYGVVYEGWYWICVHERASVHAQALSCICI